MLPFVAAGAVVLLLVLNGKQELLAPEEEDVLPVVVVDIRVDTCAEKKREEKRQIRNLRILS